MQSSNWRQQAGLPETPISLYQQRFGGLDSPTIKLAADLGKGNQLEQECQQALNTGRPIQDFSHYVPEYARNSARRSSAAQTGEV